MTFPQVTFILPVYNAEKYLSFCLDSILNQSFHNLEIICVNDCSEDTSASILSDYVRRDSRITTINCSKNIGPGAARNIGLDAADGEFVRMVDSDDFIPPYSTEHLLKAAKQFNSDFVRGGVWYCDSTGKKVEKNSLSPKKKVERAAMDHRMIDYFPHHWAFLYRTGALRASGVRYDEAMRNGQDAAFMIDLAPHMSKVSLVPEGVYNYRVNSGSVMRKKRTQQFYLNVFSLYSRAKKQYSEVGLIEVADSYLYSHCCGYLPDNILNSLPAYLPLDQGIGVLKELQKLFLEMKARSLCFSEKYSWQKKRKVPQKMKYLLLLLENNLFSEGYASIQDYRIHQKKQATITKQINLYKKRIDVIHSSSSWKITAPLRFLRSKVEE